MFHCSTYGCRKTKYLTIISPNENFEYGYPLNKQTYCNQFVRLSQSFHIFMVAFCLLISFANSLDPDQARQKSGLNWIHLMVFL